MSSSRKHEMPVLTEAVAERVRECRAAWRRHSREDDQDRKRKRQETPGWRANAPESARYLSREFRGRNPRLAANARQLCAGAEGRASAQRVPFDLTAGWIFHKLLAGVCEATGMRFEASQPGRRSNFAPSVDRRIPALGYTRANCQVVVWCYNAAKGSGTDEDVMRLAEALVHNKALKDGGTSTQ